MPSSAGKLRQRASQPTSVAPANLASDKSSARRTAGKDDSSPSTVRAVLATTASEWLMILTLIFGGCCSNAYTLELATRQLPSAGTLITFAQFLVTTLSSLPYFLVRSRTFPYIGLRQRAVPLYRWLVQVAFYLSTSLLNNMAFAYSVPMSVHIVFRSGGLVVNMILGYCVQRRRYSPLQIASVVLVTLGVVASTLDSTGTLSSAAKADAAAGVARKGGEYATGVLLLFSALVLTGFMGVWQEKTFRLYGNQNWRESMFYSHLLSLPMFALRPAGLLRDIRNANATTPWWFGFGPPISPSPAAGSAWGSSLLALATPPSVHDRTPVRTFDLDALLPSPWAAAVAREGSGKGVWVPSFYPPLLLNVATQLLCINGVNRLTAKVSSLSVTLVLVVRKALSLLISVLLVQRSTGSPRMWSGAFAVLAGTIGYSLSNPPPPRKKTEGKDKKDT